MSWVLIACFGFVNGSNQGACVSASFYTRHACEIAAADLNKPPPPLLYARCYAMWAN